MSRAQTTVFLLLGLVIVIAGFMMIYLLDTVFDFSPLLTEDDVQYYVELCVKYTAEEGLHKMGVQGGYIHINKPYFSSPFSDIVYKDYLPTLDSMEYELEQYINDNIASCILNFTTARNIALDDPDSEVMFGQRNVVITLNEFVSLKTNDTFKTVPHVQSDAIRVRMPLLHSIAKNLLDDRIDMGLLSQPGLNTTVLNFPDDTVYVITDSMSDIRAKNYRFITVV